LTGQQEFVPEPISEKIEPYAQRYYSQIISAKKNAIETKNDVKSACSVTADYMEVDVSSLKLIQPRTVGVEHAGLQALKKLGIPELLQELGFNGVQRSCAIASIIGRMAVPASELSTLAWLQKSSSMGELLDIDFEGVALSQLYRVSDKLLKNREAIEQKLFGRISELFSLPTTVTLYDLTNTYFEGDAANNSDAQRGHSKEKRTDAPIVTLALVLDSSGFIRGSRMFAGNVCEGTTLKDMLEKLNAPKEALVIMDRGIATEENVVWLIKEKYRYLVVNRERTREFDESKPYTTTTTASNEIIRMQKVLSVDGQEVRLYCHSEKREEKEMAMSRRFIKGFEDGLSKMSAGLTTPRGQKNYDKLLERIGRLKERCHGIGQHYSVTVIPDGSGKKAVSLTWEKKPITGSMVTNPGVYCLRSNETRWDEATLWQTYTMLTDLESVFRSLKSELGLRPIFHHTQKRTDGHLFITVLAYQAVQVLRKQLKLRDETRSWQSLRRILSVQQRVTATFVQKNGLTLHVRKATVAEPELQTIYNILKISSDPGGTKKMFK
jgi:transposase